MDIKLRGKNCKVYDLDGKVKKLREACVWFDNQGNYMKPLPYTFIISDILRWYNSNVSDESSE